MARVPGPPTPGGRRPRAEPLDDTTPRLRPGGWLLTDAEWAQRVEAQREAEAQATAEAKAEHEAEIPTFAMRYIPGRGFVDVRVS